MAPTFVDVIIPNCTEGITCFCTVTNVINRTHMVRVHRITAICIIEYLHIIFVIDFVTYHEGTSMAVAMLRNAFAMTIFIGTDDIFLVPYTPVPILFATFVQESVLF